jgi:hypothetical protein
VVVTDKSGNPVAGLKQQDFTLRDNGGPEKIVSFQSFDPVTAEPDPPVEVILVIDELDMAPLQLSIAEHEAENFLCRHQGATHPPRWTNSRCSGRVPYPRPIIYRASGTSVELRLPSSAADVMASSI